MSSDHSASLAGTRGLLRGQRTRSYGSLVSSSLSPVRQRRIKHKVQPGETLQGLSLKYGVSMEEIKRANRLYTNDSIFLKESLFIPVPTESVSFTNGVELTEDEASPAAQIHTEFSNEIPKSQTDSRCEANADLSPVEYLKKIDSLINQSKQAAVKTCQEGEKHLVVQQVRAQWKNHESYDLGFQWASADSLHQKKKIAVEFKASSHQGRYYND
ncbi:lysM and putative peptidoglycan-binding domain-containing protein 1-like isoform X1 [Sinocyclocheilus grahami]|uniref:LysM and putative peptidoglycan-binding domain-containing protein 1 n=1 Tax=Sinocyclocheilus grahami TaxID=75366 RepID=A0A672RQ79_SINGR|nr:PREDICTED: lysM and putative peptidoglycan-binding domain-containing protein 1-like isoform X1 [Sinocyclocheilus grahami]XP_016144702.1 PREDICTED: lysM and putative peptidoglycan-binding domain-containing protein 1-like isoform X1 [Sinocyclocheilus grahami]